MRTACPAAWRPGGRCPLQADACPSPGQGHLGHPAGGRQFFRAAQADRGPARAAHEKRISGLGGGRWPRPGARVPRLGVQTKRGGTTDTDTCPPDRRPTTPDRRPPCWWAFSGGGGGAALLVVGGPAAPPHPSGRSSGPSPGATPRRGSGTRRRGRPCTCTPCGSSCRTGGVSPACPTGPPTGCRRPLPDEIDGQRPGRGTGTQGHLRDDDKKGTA